MVGLEHRLNRHVLHLRVRELAAEDHRQRPAPAAPGGQATRSVTAAAVRATYRLTRPRRGRAGRSSIISSSLSIGHLPTVVVIVAVTRSISTMASYTCFSVSV